MRKYMLWVRDGKPFASIVVGPTCSPVECFAAEELSKYVGKITGVPLPVTTEPISGAKILVGRSPALDELNLPLRFPSDLPDAFITKTVGKHLALIGRGDRGTLYAVYTLLEKYLDVRFLAPGEEGEEVPSADRIELPEINEAESPDLAYRCKGSVGSIEEIACPESLLMLDWMAKNRINTFLIPVVYYDKMKTAYGDEIAKRAIDMEVGHHDFDYWVPQTEFFDEHPEYFSLVKGRRKRAEKTWIEGLAFGTQLCLSNPEVARITAERIKAYFRDHPEVTLLDLWPNDNFGPCRCDECMALNEPGHAKLWPKLPKRSRSYQLFVNRVAEQVAAEFRDRRISMLSYVDGLEPAEDVPMHPNVDVNLALYRECYAHSMDDPACERNRFYREVLEKWLKLAKRVVLFEYYYKVAWLGLPWGLVRKTFADQRCYRDMGLHGNAPQITVMNFGSLGLNYYAFAKAAWDCDLDADEVMTDYCRRYHGPAGAEALRFHRELEEATAAAGKTGCPLEAFHWSVPHVFTAHTRQKLHAAVQATEEAVADASPTFQRRVRELSVTMEYVSRHCASLDGIEAAKAAKESGDTLTAAKLLDEAEKTGLDAFVYAHQHQKDRIFVMAKPGLNEHYVKRWHRTIVREREELADHGELRHNAQT